MMKKALLGVAVAMAVSLMAASGASAATSVRVDPSVGAPPVEHVYWDHWHHWHHRYYHHCYHC